MSATKPKAPSTMNNSSKGAVPYTTPTTESDRLLDSSAFLQPVKPRESLKQITTNMCSSSSKSVASISPHSPHSPQPPDPPKQKHCSSNKELTQPKPSSVPSVSEKTQGKSKCPHCSKEYAFKSGLSKHLRKEHSGSTSTRYLQCNQCNSR